MGLVQYIGKEKAINAYCGYDVDAWALFQGARQLIQAGDDETALAKLLNELEPFAGSAVYTVRVYRGIEDVEEITPATEPSAQFKFQFGERAQVGTYGNANDVILKRLEKIEEKINGTGDEETDFDLNSIVMGWLNSPEKLGQVVGAVRMLFGKGDTPVAAIGSTQPMNGAEVSKDEQVEKLAAALDRLEKCDPHLVEHLDKLATIAETKPDTFKFLLQSLNAV